MNRRARRELRIQNDEGAEGGREITRSGACLPRWYVSQPWHEMSVPLLFLIRIIPLRAQICGACRPSRIAFSGHVIHKPLFFPAGTRFVVMTLLVFHVVELTFRMLGTHFLSLVLCVFLPLNCAPPHFSISESTILKRAFLT